MADQAHFPKRDQTARTLSAQDARQGQIILQRPWQRVLFIIGLAGGALLALILTFARYG
jgi:hypothetical protein